VNGLPLFPREGSTFAPRTDLLLLFLVGLASLFTIVVVAAILFFIVRYRRRSDDEVPPQISGSDKIEITWIAVPTMLALVAFFFGARLYMDMYAPPVNAMDVYIVARQWMWKAQHPEGQEEIDELHIPVGQPVKLTMTSQDVIHSFFVPDFRAKQDVLPGRYTTMWFEASAPGTYRLMCAEYCGTNHAHMLGRIIAMDPTAYADWLNTGATQSPASIGARLFQQFACVSCHRDDSLRRAPPLEGLYGQPVRLTGGGMVVADESYLRESILNPSAKVVEGWEPIMPSFQGQIDEDQLFDLIVYIKSLGKP
jgi:cytochrome c oxidase subunit 2